MVNALYTLAIGFINGMLDVPRFFWNLITGGSQMEYTTEILSHITATGSWVPWAIGVACGTIIISILLVKPVMLVISLLNPTN